MRKSLYVYMILPLLFTYTLQAQEVKKIKVSEETCSFSNGSHNCLSVTIYGGEKSDIEKEFKKEMKDKGAKVSSKKEIFADDAQMKELGDNSADIYAIVEGKDQVYNLKVAVDLGGAYMSSREHSSQYDQFEKFLYSFAVNATKSAINNEIKSEEKNLSKMEGDLKDLEKDKEKLEGSIKDYEQKIEQAKKDIEQNKKDQESKKNEITSQKKVVEDLQLKEKAVK